eukprot:TRINITY_DN2396_c0_g1_i1.p1 TRINITY_DN2396_c0_g1~~TRINITY_DN2396_c0_g1_i1.p1  ORF type:complete len:436 (+),score=48.76 TRINITY_DN2396_c0_g1_i1:798-2105(+)
MQQALPKVHGDSEHGNASVLSLGHNSMGSRYDSANSSNAAHSPNRSSPSAANFFSSTLPPARADIAMPMMPALREIHERINTCSARLEAEVAESALESATGNAAKTGPGSIGNDPAAKTEAWQEVEWLRQAVVGMHSHLMLVQQRQKSFEKECQEFQAQIEKAGITASSSAAPGPAAQLRPQPSVSPIRRVVSAGTVSSVVRPAHSTMRTTAPLASPSVPQLWGAFPAPCSAAPEVIVKTVAPPVASTPPTSARCRGQLLGAFAVEPVARSRSHERMTVQRSRQAAQCAVAQARPDPLSRTLTPRSVARVPSRSLTPWRNPQDSHFPVASPGRGQDRVATAALPGGFIRSPARQLALDGTASVPAPMRSCSAPRTPSVPRTPRGYCLAAKQPAPAAPLAAIPWQFAGAASVSGISPRGVLSPSMPFNAVVKSVPP